MTDKNLTDNEIIKALECCRFHDCESCDFGKLPLCECIPKVAIHALVLINRLQADNKELQDLMVKYNGEFARQEAEIERLKRDKYFYVNGGYELLPRTDINEIKAEAYKECIEKVKNRANTVTLYSMTKPIEIEYYITETKLDNLLKELVGEDNP